MKTWKDRLDKETKKLYKKIEELEFKLKVLNAVTAPKTHPVISLHIKVN